MENYQFCWVEVNYIAELCHVTLSTITLFILHNLAYIFANLLTWKKYLMSPKISELEANNWRKIFSSSS